MTPFWNVKYGRITAFFIACLVAADIFALGVHALGWWPLKIVLFACIALLPGIILLRILRVSLRAISILLLYAFALSLLVLMVSGVISNSVLYAIGVARPLDTFYVFMTWNIATIGLIVCCHLTNRTTLRLSKLRTHSLNKKAWVLIAFSGILPLCAALGAWRLNNGSDGALALFTLCFAAALIVYACVKRHKIPEGAMSWFVFMCGLSILLMTSMRGWDMVGHDIERELRVFTLTAQQGRWDMGAFRDPYNACLSITVLPQMLSAMLGVSGVVVFKFLLQFAFAGCVVVIYMLLRQYTPKLAALAGSLLFVCYPTFINDAAMLTRQGVAYLFFALAIIIITNKGQRWRYKSLFLLCAAGAIVSHYSTAYMFVSLFALAVLCKHVAQWWHKRHHGAQTVRREKSVLSPLFAISLLLMTFVWYAQITATSNGLLATLQKSLANIPSLFSDEGKSSDISGVLFSGGKTQADIYEDYLSGAHKKESGNTDAFLPSLTEDTLPPTALGLQLQKWGVSLSLTNALRQNFAKILQVFAVAGVVYAAYRFIRHKPHAQGLDFTCLSVASIVVLGLMVILPVLSVNYGILRAFQQTLIFLILPIMLLLIRMLRPLPSRLVNGCAVAAITSLFLLFTGVTAQALGGTSAPLTLNNQGLYYGLYYASAADKASHEWMKHHIHPDADLRAANPNRALMNDPAYPFNRTGILPMQLSPGSYAYLDLAQIRDEKFFTYFESSPLTLTFPMQYYDLAKNHVYSTSTTGVYK
jgi:uncharacterized membrane protein